jgi:hypothetical protein
VAAEENRPNVIEFLISKGGDLNALDRHDEPPLFRAIRGRLLENVKLLSCDFAIDFAGKSRRRPLHIAAELGYSEIVEFLLSQRPGDVGIGDAEMNTPLHLAVIQKHKEVCHILLDAGSDVMVRNDAGQSVFAMATGAFRIMIQKFIAHRPDGLKTRPIDRTPKSTRQREGSPPGRLGSRASTPSASGRSTSVRSSHTDPSAIDGIKAFQAGITGDIERAKEHMFRQLQNLRELIREFRSDLTGQMG